MLIHGLSLLPFILYYSRLQSPVNNIYKEENNLQAPWLGFFLLIGGDVLTDIEQKQIRSAVILAGGACMTQTVAVRFSPSANRTAK